MKPTYGGTLAFSCLCSGSPLCHHYTDTSLIRQDSECLSLYSEFQRAKINGIRKRSLYSLGHLEANYQRFLKTIFIYLQKKYLHSYLAQENFRSGGSQGEQYFVHSRFQMVAGETKLFMRASAAIFKTIPQVVADGIGLLGSDLRKTSSNGSRRERHF